MNIDVTYLPKFDGHKNYVFVAIDRATRILFYKVYDAKPSENAEDFMNHCIDFFPFEITHVLTDNGLEFTNRLLSPKKETFVKNRPSLMKYVKKIILNIVLQNPILLKQMVWLRE